MGYFPGVEVGFEVGVNPASSVVGTRVEHPNKYHEPEGVKARNQIEDEPERVVNRGQESKHDPVCQPHVFLFFILLLHSLNYRTGTLKLM